MINLSNALIEQISTRQDGSLKIVLGTQELSPDEMQKLFTAFGKFRGEEEDALESVKLNEQNSEGIKTPSSRLRAVLFVLFKQQSKYKSFDAYYAQIMETIIEQFKERIEKDTVDEGRD
jgi:membrane carboxypeptidase/penicillin-binding protein PbpC